MPTNVPNDPPDWHLEKSADYDVTGTWLVIVDGELAGSVRPCWSGLYSSKPHWQGWTTAAGAADGDHHVTGRSLHRIHRPPV